MKSLQHGDKAAIVCCSNGQTPEYRSKLEKLGGVLRQIGIEPVFGPYIYRRDGVAAGTAQERAESLMKFYRDPEIKAVFDVSGGDVANEILPLLDFDLIAAQEKLFWGYSDLTTILNAIYARTGRPSMLYQIRNLIYDDAEEQIRRFAATVMQGQEDLLDFPYQFIQGDGMDGIVVGGNIRCLLKLAGTAYWPDMAGKILLLEGYSGTVARMVTYLSQLEQMGVFRKVQGILLGTFTEMEEQGCVPSISKLVKDLADPGIPIAVTEKIGHGADSRGIMIGNSHKLLKL